MCTLVTAWMKYDDAFEWLYETQLFGIKLGLDNISRLLTVLGVCDDLSGKKIIHVAGTNGKGSVCAFAERILRDAGFRTGLFTSPHLVSFCERIRIDGIEVGESEVAEGLSLIREEVEGWEQHPTFFEITLALAMRIFCDVDCERIILETGMGGRLDATNSLPAEVSVITSIALDHQQWLGDTLEEIVTEKAGIIKPGVPVITSDPHGVIVKRAAEMGAQLIKARPLPDGWESGLQGRYQRENAALAVAAVRQLGNEISESTIRRAIASTEWPGRFQIIRDRLILDGAHNEAAAEMLTETWREAFGEGEKAHLIFGVADSKDAAGLLRHLVPISSRITFVSIQSDRQVPTGEMKAVLAKVSGKGLPVREFNTLGEALEYSAGLKEKTLLTGSLFLVGEALAILQKGGKGFEVSSQ